MTVINHKHGKSNCASVYPAFGLSSRHCLVCFLLLYYCTYSKTPGLTPVDRSLRQKTLNLSRTSRLARTFLSFAGNSCSYVHSRRFPLSNDEINYSIKLDLCGLILTDMICYGYLFQTLPLLLLIQ